MAWAVALAVVVLSATPSAACDSAVLGAHVLDPNEEGVDTTPPSAIGTSTFSVGRGSRPEQSGCGQSGTSCDGIGSISVNLGEVSDDRTTEANLGYRVEVVAGTAPALGLPADGTAVRAFEGRALYFHWNDGEGDQESIDFTLRVRAVDLAGNEGPPTEIRIRDSGSDEGCRTAASGSTDVSLPLLGAFVLLVWARSRRKT